MALKKQTVSIPFAQGLMQKTADSSSKLGTLKDCKNIQINKLGEIKKRYGLGIQIQADSSSTPYDTVYPQAGKKLSSLNNNAIMLDGQRAYAQVSGTKFKDAGEILATELQQENIHEANEAKVGPVAFKKITTGAGSLDVYMWTQTTPFEAGVKLYPTYKTFIEFKQNDTQIRVSPIIEVTSQSREDTHAGTFDSDIEYLTMGPQTQMLYSNTTDHLYLFYYEGSGSQNIKYKSIDLSSATPSFTLSSASNIVTTACASVGTFAVVSHNDEQTMYLAYYKANTISGNDNPGDVSLVQVTESSGGSLSATAAVDATNNRYNARNSQLAGLSSKTGCRVNLALRVLDSTAASFNVFLAYSAQDSGKSYNGYLTFVDIWKPSLSTSLFNSGVGDPHGLPFAINSRHGMLNAASAAIKSGSGGSVVYSIALELCSDQGQSLDNVLTGTVTKSAAGSNYVNGLASVAASTTSPAAFGEVPAQVILDVTGGAITNDAFDIIHPGNQFVAGTNAISQTGASGGTTIIASPANIESNQDNITLIKPDHGIYTFELDTSVALPSGVQNVTSFTFKDASLISDVFIHNFGSNGNTAYFAVSKTVGNGSSSSGNTYVANADGDVVATFLTGNQALNLTSEIDSRIRNKFSLLGPISRVYSGAQDFQFGSNEFIADEDISADLGQTETSSVTTDQNYTGVLYHFKKTVDREYPTQEVGLKTYIGGGSLFVYDGTHIFENNFWEFPQIKVLKEIERIEGSADAETVSYAFVFSSVDDAGDLHESVTVLSDPISKAANKSICGQIYITDFTRRDLTDGSSARPQLDIYRTENNGSVFFKIQSIAFNATDRCITFVDDFKNVIDKEQLLYTTGGIPDNFTTGSISDMVLYKNRLMVASVSGRNIVLASKPLSQGFSCGFPLIPPFQILIQDETEKITGIEKMPDFLLCFSADNAYAVFGDGPNAAGAGGFSGAKNIAPRQGLVPGGAHLSTSLGAFYVSERGLYMVTPNTQINYLGASVEDSFVANAGTTGTPVKSLVLDDDENEIRMLMQNNSVVLIYNTFFNTWYQWDISTGNTANQKIVDQRIINRTYLALQANGTVLVASKAGYQDQYYSSGGSPTTTNYNMEVELHSVSVNGLQGAQRVYRVQLLGDYIDANDLTMQIFNDYATSATETHTLGIASDTDPYIYRAHLKNQKSRAISLKISVSGNGASVILNGVAFEVGARAGTFKLPAAQTIAEV